MNITADQVEQALGIIVTLAIPVAAVFALAKDNKGVDGYTWGSNGLTWDSPADRPIPKQDQRHPAAKAE